jgi:hypothetical protein
MMEKSEIEILRQAVVEQTSLLTNVIELLAMKNIDDNFQLRAMVRNARDRIEEPSVRKVLDRASGYT